jgi:nucleoid-associated protein YgaU
MAQQDKQLEQLKGKYQSALNTGQQEGIRLHHLHIQDGKLFMQGEAPSNEAKNKVWDAIKRIDPSYSDLTADITVNPALPNPQKDSAANAGGGQNISASHQRYTVKPGDTLSKIAQQFYKDANQYTRIFEANRDQLQDPDRIKAGQELKIPS